MTSAPTPAPSGPPAPDTAATLTTLLQRALAAGTRQAFTALLSEDVRWGGERRGEGNECTTREQASDHYAGLLAQGVTLHLEDLQPAEPAGDGNHGDEHTGLSGDAVFTARLQVRSPDPDDYPPQMPVRLRLRDGLITDICHLDPPVDIEVLYFDGCPHFDLFLPHLRELLREHGIRTPITLTRIDGQDDAHAHRFLGSPSLRISGHDVEPDVAELESRSASSEHGGAPGSDAGDEGDGRYGMQCRLYVAADGGTAGIPQDRWIVDALVDNPVHEAAIAAVHTGDLPTLQDLLAKHPGLATARLPRHQGRTLLHVATDWPGHHPNVAATITALVAAGADPNRGCLGEHPETPLHWAASSNDVAAIDALLDAGADIDVPGAVIAGGSPMADATAFGQWDAARRLVERGATTNLFEAAALGLLDRVQQHLQTGVVTAEDITSSFWGACHGGHVDTAGALLAAGADVNWVGYDGLTPLDAAHRSDATDVATWLERRGAASATAS